MGTTSQNLKQPVVKQQIIKQQVINQYLPQTTSPGETAVTAFAPSNIALCKYWGKRDTALNLPMNASLSVSLGNLGSHTTIVPSLTDGDNDSGSGSDHVFLNGERQPPNSRFAQKVLAFVDLFRRDLNQPVTVRTKNNIPTAAGLASSASGFAALMLAINDFYGFQLSRPVLSAFARMGSGSASRSIDRGFVEWHKGERDDGMDSCAQSLAHNPVYWKDLRVALLKVTTGEKTVGSREGMQRTVDTSALYAAWPQQAAADLVALKAAIAGDNFAELGKIAEHNALSMHATMVSAWPPLLYWLPESLAAMQRVWALRDAGLPIYLTMDAGANLKLLFEAKHCHDIRQAFPDLTDADVVAPILMPLSATA